MGHGGSNKYYDPTNKVVYDQQVAEADDLNSVNTAVDTAFALVADDLDTLEELIEGGAGLAEEWAENEQGDAPDPLQPTKFSSKANAEEAEGWTSGEGGVATKADGVTTIARSAKEYSEDTAADAVQTAADRVATNQDTIDTAADLVFTNADAVQTGLDAVQTAADRVQTGLDAVQTGEDAAAALVSEGNASDSEDAAGVSETNASNSESLASSAASAAGISESNASDSESSASDDADRAAASALVFQGVNLLINGGFPVNQEVLSGTVVLSSGEYGHDMWKAGSGGCTYTFVTTLNVTTLTISAGTLVQIIEDVNVPSGAVTLSWVGTAQGKIDSGSYGSTGLTGTLVGGTQSQVEFGTGTIAQVQLELASVPTTFEYESYGTTYAKCRRYRRYYSGSSNLRLSNGYASSVTGAILMIPQEVGMRGDATLTYSAIGDFSVSNTGIARTLTAFTLQAQSKDTIVFNVDCDTGLTDGDAVMLFMQTGGWFNLDATL